MRIDRGSVSPRGELRWEWEKWQTMTLLWRRKLKR